MTQTRAGLFTAIGGVSGIVVIDFFGERLAHPRRRGKPEFKLERCPPLERIGNSSPSPCRHNTRSTHSRQVLLRAHSHQPFISGQRPSLFGVRRDVMRGTGEKCTLPTIRNWQLTPLTAPRQRLIHTNPRSAACAISAAQGYRSQSFLAGGFDPPRPASLHNYQLRVSPACQRPRQRLRSTPRCCALSRSRCPFCGRCRRGGGRRGCW